MPTVKGVLQKYHEGQNIFRREAVSCLVARIEQLEKYIANQQSVQAGGLKPCAECGALGYSHRPSCSKHGSYVVSTRR